jgi:hypothetical protein
LSCESDAPQVGSVRFDSTRVVKVNGRKTNRRKTRPYSTSITKTRTLQPLGTVSKPIRVPYEGHHQHRTVNVVDVHGSVHHTRNDVEITNKMRPCIRIYYSIVSYCSTSFERHIAHHQKLKNCIFILWFTYVCGCRPLSAAGNHKRM